MVLWKSLLCQGETAIVLQCQQLTVLSEDIALLGLGIASQDELAIWSPSQEGECTKLLQACSVHSNPLQSYGSAPLPVLYTDKHPRACMQVFRQRRQM